MQFASHGQTVSMYFSLYKCKQEQRKFLPNGTFKHLHSTSHEAALHLESIQIMMTIMNIQDQDGWDSQLCWSWRVTLLIKPLWAEFVFSEWRVLLCFAQDGLHHDWPLPAIPGHGQSNQSLCCRIQEKRRSKCLQTRQPSRTLDISTTSAFANMSSKILPKRAVFCETWIYNPWPLHMRFDINWTSSFLHLTLVISCHDSVCLCQGKR